MIPLKKTIDFSMRRPTDYKMNNRVKLPKPLDLDGEFQCETRRRLYQQTFEKYKDEIDVEKKKKTKSRV